LHGLQIVAIVVVALAAINRSEIPGAIPFFVGVIIVNMALLWIYVGVWARGYEHSLLGRKLPSAVPSAAWIGITLPSPVMIGSFSVHGKVRWVLSNVGVIVSVPILITVYLRWEDIVAIEPRCGGETWNLWCIRHRASDIRSPITCGANVADAMARFMKERN
jgi:hypothetical protein